MEFAIASARSRTATRWKNESWTLEAFIEVLKKPVVTRETMDEYKHLPKAERDRLKDVGGFVAGTLKDGRRKSDCVGFRSMVTLDLDKVNIRIEALKDKLYASLSCQWILYPTHSYQPHAPRVRLIIPLDTPIHAEKYEPISRYLAGLIGIDMVDDTTHQASRLMYWPSVPCDVDYDEVFTVTSGTLLNPQTILDKYADWTDTSFWPTSKREEIAIKREIKAQENPLMKKGTVGAFCRAFSLPEAIERFLTDQYEPADKPNRYTFKQGSTNGGVIIYDDIFAYTHHGTAPTSGLLCNAFDFVRLHLFGVLDKEVKPDMPTNKRPSYDRMCEMAASLDEVRAILWEAAVNEFEYEDIEANTEQWQQQLELDKKGIIKQTIHNVKLILNNDPKIKGKLYTDIFSGRTIVTGELPWSKESELRDWNDGDIDGLMWYMERKYKIAKETAVKRGLGNVFLEHKKHPVRDYLNSLNPWDGEERLATLLIDYLGAEDTPFIRHITKTHLVAAVARVMNPGVKYDTMITLSGRQGIGKSSLPRILCGDAWFNDTIREFKGKEPYEGLRGNWFIEISELAAFKKAEKEEFKSYMSKTEDVYRPSYGHYTVRYPRQCIFWGTTNDALFLRDKSGDRRTWPVAVGVNFAVKDVFSELAQERDQIWAEALKAYRDGWKIALSAEMEQEANKTRSMFKEEDPKAESILHYLEQPILIDWDKMTLQERINWLHRGGVPEGLSDRTMPRNSVTALEVWCECFRQDASYMHTRDAAEINEILANVDGWVKWKHPIRLGFAYHDERRRGFKRI